MSLCINPRCRNPQNPDNSLFCQACGSELLLAGRYRVIRLLSGKGGFGNTYEVTCDDTPKVLKVLTNPIPKAVELFQQEARVLSQLNHPGIPKGEMDFTFFPRDSQEPLYCLVMEKIEGLDLEEYLQGRQNRPIDERLALEWLTELVKVLHEVHQQQFFHRDIKPSNIMLGANGHLMLIDFGTVRQVTGTIVSGGRSTSIYTVGYAPPEQEHGYAVPESDFFALGRTFVYLLTGKQPTDTDIYDYYNNELRWRDRAYNISPQLADLIDKMMAAKASQRPANTQVILQRLHEIDRELHQPGSGTCQNPQTRKVVSSTSSSTVVTPEYAGFWRRAVAYLLDTVILGISGFVIGGVLYVFLMFVDILPSDINETQAFFMGGSFAAVGTVSGVSWSIFLISIYILNYIYWYDYFWWKTIISIAIYVIVPVVWKWFYFTLLESSHRRGTFGKMIMRLAVTDLKGDRLSFGRANSRYWGKTISAIIIGVGFIMAGKTKKKQALHDKMARCLVVKKP